VGLCGDQFHPETDEDQDEESAECRRRLHTLDLKQRADRRAVFRNYFDASEFVETLTTQTFRKLKVRRPTAPRADGRVLKESIGRRFVKEYRGERGGAPVGNRRDETNGRPGLRGFRHLAFAEGRVEQLLA
jgi:hypothetical protein